MEYVTPIDCGGSDPERAYEDGCEANGELGSLTPARFFNLMLAEGRNLVEGAGLTLDPLNDMQWLEAIQSLADTAAATAVVPVEARVTTLETEVADLDGRTGVLEARATTLESRADNLEMRDDAIVIGAGMTPDPNNPNEVLEAILNLVRSEGVPTGSVQAFGQSTSPAGWLECDGRAVSRTTYANLFAAIGTTYGGGNGSTTFNLPDLRGEFVRGWDHGRGVDSGRGFGSDQTDALQQLYGNIDVGGFTTSNGITDNSGTGVLEVRDRHVTTTNFDSSAGSGSDHLYDIGFDASRSARTAEETRPRNVALLYCIKA